MAHQAIAVSHDTSLNYVEYQGQPVVTFSMVDKVHCRNQGNAKWNFNHNRKHFTEGEDFYLVDFSKRCEFHSFGISVPPRGIIVLTESGYLLLVKSFTDDLAWQVQKQLIKSYFRAKAISDPDRDYERITPEQRAALADAVSRALRGWVFAYSQGAPQHLNNRLRATFRISHIEALPKADFERALAIVAQVEASNSAFLTWISDIKKTFLREYVQAGAPWTPQTALRWTKAMGQELPPRPDWAAMRDQLNKPTTR